MQSILGFLVIFGLLFLLSENRKKIPWKLLIAGFFLQFVLALILLKIPVISQILGQINQIVQILESVTAEATGFIFGYLSGGEPPFESVRPDKEYILAFRVLPMIMVVSALSSLFYHWGILPWIIKQLSKLFVRTLKINGPLGFGASATIFLGTVEAPLLIRPYLLTMSRSDLFALITCTMATIAGTVMVIYASIVGQIVPNAFTHMLVASLVSIPAALMISKTLIPDRTDNKVTLSDISSPPRQTKGAMDAVIKGTLDGLDMVLKIAAIIIVLFSLVYLTNHFLAIIPAGEKPFTVEGIVGTVLRPFLWLIGIPWEETQIASQLMGSKIILNEFVAYIQMSKLPEGALSGKTSLIMTYALCGFANLGSVGIVIGGLGTLLPERSEEIIELCLKSLVSGNLATLMTAGVVGLMS